MAKRDYLPYKSAREYVDRGMAKWMGFFISEHTTALNHMGDEIDISEQMSDEEILILITQVYINKLKIMIYTNIRQEPFIGKIEEIIDTNIYLSGDEPKYISFSEIIRIILMEEL